MKIIRLILGIIAFAVFVAYKDISYAGCTVLSDSELDQVSAAGFDINIDAVLAFRQAVAISQNNIAAISGSSNTDSLINNSNFSSVATLTQAMVHQKNMTAVVAKEGNITGATLNNENFAEINAFGPAEAVQNNLSLLIALNGGITNSAINNLNTALLNSASATAVVSQQNISIMVATGVMDNNVINNMNIADAVGVSSGVNSGSQTVQSFTYKDIIGVININNSISDITRITED